MNNQTALLRQTLDALVEIKSIVDTLLPGAPLGHEGSPEMMAINAIDAIRAELAKPQVEPVAWRAWLNGQWSLSHKQTTVYNQPLYAAPQAQPASSWVWQHRKGSEYTLIGVGKLQCDVPPNDMAEVVLYRAEIDGKLWARPEAEFNERFKRLRPLAQPAVPPDMVLVPVEYFAAAPSAVPEWVRRQANQRGAEIVQPVPVALTDEQIAGEASTVWDDFEDDIDRRTEFARAVISKFCEVNGIGEAKP